MSRILILNDGSKYENWGIKACIDGLKEIFKQIDDVEISGLPHSFMIQRYGFEPKILGRNIFEEDGRIAKKFFVKFHELPKVADEFDFFADLWLSGKGGKGADEFIQKAKEADLIVFNGEGSAYRNNIGAIKGLFCLWFAKTRLNKKTAFMNGSVTLTKVDAVLPAMIRKVFSTIDLAIVREEYSYKSICSNYPELGDRVRVFPDSSYVLSSRGEKLPKLDFLDKDFFVFSLSMLPMDYRASRSRSALVEIINSLKKVVPNVVLIAKDREDQILKAAAKDTGAEFIGPDFSYKQIIQLLERSKFILSGRYHHLIFATIAGCPAIPMASSSHKIHGLSNFFDFMDDPIDPTDLRNESGKIVASAKRIILNGDSLRNIYKKRSLELREKALSQADLIRRLL